MAWVYLLLAGAFEIVWSFALKASAGFTRWGWVAVAAVGMTISVVLLAIAMRSLPLGTAYAIWTGIGAAGAVVVGIVVLGEPATALRLGSIALIVAGIAGLKLASD